MAESDAIVRAFRGEYRTTKVDRFVKVRSRCLFPDGYPAELYVPNHDPRILMDLGETMQWLRARQQNFEITDADERLVEEVCLSRSIDYAHGMFLTRVEEVGDLPRGLDRLARATVWLAEMWMRDSAGGTGVEQTL